MSDEQPVQHSKVVPAWRFRGLNQHPSYQGVMTKEEAEIKLQKCDIKCLTRYDKAHKSYIFSVLSSEGGDCEHEFAHLVINMINTTSMKLRKQERHLDSILTWWNPLASRNLEKGLILGDQR